MQLPHPTQSNFDLFSDEFNSRYAIHGFCFMYQHGNFIIFVGSAILNAL